MPLGPLPRPIRLLVPGCDPYGVEAQSAAKRLFQLYRSSSRIDKDTAADGEGCSTVLPRREGAVWTRASAAPAYSDNDKSLAFNNFQQPYRSLF